MQTFFSAIFMPWYCERRKCLCLFFNLRKCTFSDLQSVVISVNQENQNKLWDDYLRCVSICCKINPVWRWNLFQSQLAHVKRTRSELLQTPADYCIQAAPVFPPSLPGFTTHDIQGLKFTRGGNKCHTISSQCLHLWHKHVLLIKDYNGEQVSPDHGNCCINLIVAELSVPR